MCLKYLVSTLPKKTTEDRSKKLVFLLLVKAAQFRVYTCGEQWFKLSERNKSPPNILAAVSKFQWCFNNNISTCAWDCEVYASGQSGRYVAET